MRRPIAPCACVLALVTGAWMGQAYSLLAPPDPIGEAGASSPRTAGIAWRFYDAIDLLFRTGDDAAVRDVVAPGFVDHVASPAAPGDRDGLLGHLASLRATHPALRLSPHDVIAEGDRAVAQITLDGDVQGAVMGIPLGGVPPWPAVEVVRVEGERIAERWGGPTGSASSTPLLPDATIVSVRGDVLPYLRRVTFTPGASTATLNRNRTGPAIVAVESGELDVATNGAGSTSSPAANRTLGPGDTLVIPEDIDLDASNRTDAPAVVLLLTFAPATQDATQALTADPIDIDSGIEIRGLAGTARITVPKLAGRVTVQMAAITLAPSVRLSAHPTANVELVAVESGTLTAAITGETPAASVREPDGHSVASGPYVQVAAGSGLSVSGGGTQTSYRNESDQPLTFLLLTLAAW